MLWDAAEIYRKTEKVPWEVDHLLNNMNGKKCITTFDDNQYVYTQN